MADFYADAESISPAANGKPTRTYAWQYLRQAGDSGAFVNRVERHTATETHDHLFHEVVYVESGSADHETTDGTRKLRPGDVIIIRPQIWHGYARPRELTIINCLIDSPLMQKLSVFLARVGGAFDLYRKRPRDPRHTPPTVLHASPAGRAVIRQRLETIMAEQRDRVNGWQDVTSAALLDLLITIARLQLPEHGAQRIEPPIADRTQQAVLDVASYLETHFSERITLAELAARVQLSPGHLSRSFARQMGMGIVEFTHRMRAEEACRLLRMTDAPITRIGSQVGYGEIAYFSRCFRGQLHQSPIEYRRHWRGRLV